MRPSPILALLLVACAVAQEGPAGRKRRKGEPGQRGVGGLRERCKGGPPRAAGPSQQQGLLWETPSEKAAPPPLQLA